MNKKWYWFIFGWLIGSFIGVQTFLGFLGRGVGTVSHAAA